MRSTHDVVPVEVAHVVGDAIRDGPAAGEGGEERGGVPPLTALRRARRRVEAENTPPRPGPSPAAPRELWEREERANLGCNDDRANKTRSNNMTVML